MSKKYKIGITCYPTYGGSGVLATELGKILAKNGHEVHFITSGVPFRLQRSFHQNIFFHQVEAMEYALFDQSPYAIALAAKMAEVVREQGLDLLHVHYAIPHATSAFLAQQMLLPNIHLPIVTTLHGTDITLVGKDASFYDITCFSIDKSTAVTSVSDYLTSETYKHFKINNKIERIYNFVDEELFSPQRRECAGMVTGTPGKSVFTHISNFRPVKRSVDVIKTFAKILEQVPDASLLMIGEGPDHKDCRNLASELNILKNVHFLGKQEDVISILAMTDVLLFPSAEESFGLVALEAMSCAIPVIGYRAGGLPEVVVHNECGFLYELGDIEGMANAGILLAQDCKLRKEMGLKGRERVLANFTTEHIVPQYEALYERLIEGTANPSETKTA
jgi:N-acetyl-alpha-D-glucosaminyl L-malate synthase BshA